MTRSHFVAGGCVFRVGDGPTDRCSGNLDVGEVTAMDFSSLALLIFASLLLTVIPKDWSYRDRKDTNPVYLCLLQTGEVAVGCSGGF